MAYGHACAPQVTAVPDANVPLAMHSYLDFFLHLDKHLKEIIEQYGVLTYAILFGILFAETGLVVMPLLPGDSLLFALGTVCSVQSPPLNISVVYLLLWLAVFCGDNVNYWIGYHVGPRVFSRDDVKYLNRRHLDRTREFFEKYGSKTVIYARFVPIVRTCAPFVAGVGRMPYLRFISFSVVGCLAWLSVCLFAGFFFGSIPAVQKNFSLAILGVIVVSMLPLMIEFIRHRRTGA